MDTQKLNTSQEEDRGFKVINILPDFSYIAVLGPEKIFIHKKSHLCTVFFGITMLRSNFDVEKYSDPQSLVKFSDMPEKFDSLDDVVSWVRNKKK